MAGEYDFEIKQGSSFHRQLIYKTSAGVIINLTSYAAKMQIREWYDKPVIETLTTDNGKIVITGAEGKIELKLTRAETAKLTKSRMIYDLDIYIPGSEDTSLITLLEGIITLDKEVTKNV